MILGGTGSDTGGSIRGPAAFCGLAGLKPTYGLISRTGIQPLAQTLDHAGPMAWTAEDCALLLQAMAGHDPEDPASADRPVPDFSAGLGQGIAGLRIGIVRHFHETDNPVAPDQAQAIDAAIAVLAELGANIRDVTLPPLEEYAACYALIVYPEAFAVHEPWVRDRFNEYGERLRNQLALGAFISGSAYVQAQRRRRELCRDTASALAEFDLLLTATATGEAPKIMEVPKHGLQKPGFTPPWNLTGYPAIAICCGFGAAGLPLSLQLVAKPFQEAKLLRAADAYEKVTVWRNRRPA
jgi:aspartyl-tRNA(Asn)/glutamyl-tRNA(Gln) amidotransferase subunit A